MSTILLHIIVVARNFHPTLSHSTDHW